MKKIIAATAVLFMGLAGTAFAGDLKTMDGIDLSTGVSGKYFSNGSSEDATHFVISTGHSQGDKVYATADFSTAIQRKGISGDTFASSDLMSKPSNWDSTAFGDTWSEM